ncbi:MAG: ATP-dependent DNA helicase, partial [Stellaceae bacterium]
MSADGGVANPVRLPKAASLVAGMTQAAWLSPEGEIALLPLAEAARRARAAPPFVCHARATARRLGVTQFVCFDLLELFAFVRPARFCVPTPRGIAAALDLDVPEAGNLAGTAEVLRASVRALLGELQMQSGDGDARAIAESMAKGGWPWADAVLAALPPAANAETPPPVGLAVWN